MLTKDMKEFLEFVELVSFELLDDNRVSLLRLPISLYFDDDFTPAMYYTTVTVRIFTSDFESEDIEVTYCWWVEDNPLGISERKNNFKEFCDSVFETIKGNKEENILITI